MSDRDSIFRVKYAVSRVEKAIHGYARISSQELIIEPALSAARGRFRLAFKFFRGSKVRQILCTWITLTLYRPIPIRDADVKWIEDQDQWPCLLLTPVWPADFVAVIWFEEPGIADWIADLTGRSWTSECQARSWGRLSR
jgi:hypothetical protein